MNIQENVKDYYGHVLQHSGDLKTDACSTVESAPEYLRGLLGNIHPDVRARYYGCGLIAPLGLHGARILDLGAGAGQDAYMLAQLAGENGEVVGVDMTPQQIAVAQRHQSWHAETFGFSNVRFLEGDLERLNALDLAPESFDVIVSNCVINLVADKDAVFRTAHDLLKPGGEFYFADIYADRRLGDEVRRHPVAQGECLGGALYWNDFLNTAKSAGFLDPRLASHRAVAVQAPELRALLEPAKFHSATYRLFKADGLEPACEDYGQAVIYKGGVTHSETAFALDHHHHMEKGRVFSVCGNTYRILKQSRFAPHFEFIGDDRTHYGIFPGCGVVSPFTDDEDASTSAGCC